MKEYMRPLWVFLLGNAAMLFLGLFLPAMADAGTQLAADTAAISGDFWGLAWVITSIRTLYYIGFELVLLFVVAKMFLNLKSQ